MKFVRAALPTRAILLLMFIGMLDLVVTAVLHEKGLIVELNPLMKVLIERSEWLFAFVKGLTLVAAWWALAWYAKQNLTFVRKAALWGSAAYVTVWCVWFFGAMAMPTPEPRADTVPVADRPYESEKLDVQYI